MSTADEVVAEATSITDKAGTKVPSTIDKRVTNIESMADEVLAKIKFKTDKATAKAASTVD